MPHQCTNCSRQFADGSKEMLSGCPECGGNKFQFLPPGSVEPPDEDPPAREETGGVAKTAVRATSSIRDWVRSSRQTTLTDLGSEPTPIDEDVGEPDATPSTDPPAVDDEPPETQLTDFDEGDVEPESTDAPALEDRAQAAARSGMVRVDELPDPPRRQPASERPRPPDREMSLAELRRELNDQFESIKIVDRGQYELNLMELYEREEYIISLRENGRYVIEVPESVYGEIDR